MNYLSNGSIRLLLLIDNGILMRSLKKQYGRDAYVSLILFNFIKLKLIDVIDDDCDKRQKIIFLTDRGEYVKNLYGLITENLSV